MEVIIGPILALALGAGFTVHQRKRSEVELEAMKVRIEQLESVAVDEGEQTRKMVNVMMPVVQAVKHLQDTVGVR